MEKDGIFTMDIRIHNVSKKYKGGVWGLRDFSLTIGPGVLGLLGPNGAGKTTLMNMLATVTKPTQGKITWDGNDIRRFPNMIRSVLGYLPQNFGIYPNLTGIEFLQYLAAIRGIRGKAAQQRINELLQLVNIVDLGKRPLGSYSGGMKQRVGIAQALLNDPKLLIVDEPTVGLDPEERVRFRHLLDDLSGERIVILSTHIVSDVEAVATDIALINHGRLVHHSPPEDILGIVDGKVWSCVVPSGELNTFRNDHLISSAIRRSDGVHIRVVSEVSPVCGAETVPPTLEDAYLHCISSTNGRPAANKA